MIDPEVVRLRQQVRGLQNAANRLAAMVPPVARVRPEKQAHTEGEDDGKAGARRVRNAG